jgi:hypothetical protein
LAQRFGYGYDTGTVTSSTPGLTGSPDESCKLSATRYSTSSRNSGKSAASHGRPPRAHTQSDGFAAGHRGDRHVSSDAESSTGRRKRLQKERRVKNDQRTYNQEFATESFCSSNASMTSSSVDSSVCQPRWNGTIPSTLPPSVYTGVYASKPLVREVSPPPPFRAPTYILPEKASRLQRMCAKLPNFIQRRVADRREMKFREEARRSKTSWAGEHASPRMAMRSVPPPPIGHQYGAVHCIIVHPVHQDVPISTSKRNRLTRGNGRRPLHWDGHCI